MQKGKFLILLLLMVMIAPITSSHAARIDTSLSVWLSLRNGENRKAFEGATALIESADDIIAHYVIGELYYRGAGVKKDYLKAYEHWSIAAQRGLPLAQNNLGSMYEEGFGVNKNCKKALFWYKKAAQPSISSSIPELGLPFSACSGLYSLGMLYKNGICVTANSDKALSYFEKSMILGYVPALEEYREMVKKK